MSNIKTQDLIIAGILLFAAAVAWPQQVWPTFQQNNQRTGQTIYVGPPTINSVWTYTVGGNIEWSSPVIAQDGTIYFGCSDSNFYAVNPDGGLKWTYSTGGKILSSPAIGPDGTIYFGSHDLNVYAIEDSTTYGRLKWTYGTSAEVQAPLLVDPQGTVYAVANTLYAIASDGNIKWTYGTGVQDLNASMALSHDGTTIYTQRSTMFEYYLASIDTNGTVNWETLIGGAPFSFSSSTPSIALDNTIYYPVFNGTIYALNPDGSYKWTSPSLGYVMYNSPAIGSGDTIYMPEDDELNAITVDGDIAWSTMVDYQSTHSPVIDGYGTIYVPFGDTMYAFNTDGSEKWKYNAGATISSTPAIDVSGTLFFCAGNQLYGIEREYVDVDENQAQQSKEELFFNISPNPFTRTTNIKLRMPEIGKQYVRSIAIYDVTGELIRVFPIFDLQSPITNIVWDGTDDAGSKVPQGTYFIKVKANTCEKIEKAILLR